MSKFIELTDKNSQMKFSVNINQITDFDDKSPNGTYLTIVNGNEYYINEPYETVKQMILEAAKCQ